MKKNNMIFRDGTVASTASQKIETDYLRCWQNDRDEKLLRAVTEILIFRSKTAPWYINIRTETHMI